MGMIPRETIQELIKEQNFTNTTDVMTAIKDMFKDVLQEIMEAELDTELGYDKRARRPSSGSDDLSKNYRNGHSKKTIKTQLGKVQVSIPRDRNGEYEPQIIGKYSRNTDGMDEKIISLYATGMSTRDISEQVKTLYRTVCTVV